MEKDHVVRQIAIWIDHKEAILATFTDSHLLNEEELFSNVDPRTHGGGLSQKHIEAHRHAVLDHFYKEIVQELNGADAIAIYGPGQAKIDLHRYIQQHHKDLDHHVTAVITTDKLSEVQFIRLALNDFSRQGNTEDQR